MEPGVAGDGTPDRRALVVEDDADIRSLIDLTLSAQGFVIRTAATGRDGLQLAREWEPDLITLDLGLPGIDGLEVCRRVREFSDAYLVVVSARQDEVDRLMALQTGADDFLVKPFSPRELQARVTAMFRRPRGAGEVATVTTAGSESSSVVLGGSAVPEGHEVLVHGPVGVDVDGRRAFVSDDEVELTRTEFDLLTHLMRTPARVWTREALLRTVWGNDWVGDAHLVEVHIGNLRRKLTQASGDKGLIHTVRGVGYRMGG
ncbi:response regulator transcription factor [Nocardioides zeae]|uniref:Response regulator transcription factor n=1 Tax=Nocardioides imazamoxiresistens TaxID=3231893 RepID=A0ABU3PUY1_9ACTN|nr:response regulator transcription factor [Nocardioides zeae]MDT9593030.1 response regulator transcription factor [Nocardioides zeae]